MFATAAVRFFSAVILCRIQQTLLQQPIRSGHHARWIHQFKRYPALHVWHLGSSGSSRFPEVSMGVPLLLAFWCHKQSHLQMDDDWGYPYDSGNHHVGHGQWQLGSGNIHSSVGSDPGASPIAGSGLQIWWLLSLGWEFSAPNRSLLCLKLAMTPFSAPSVHRRRECILLTSCYKPNRQLCDDCTTCHSHPTIYRRIPCLTILIFKHVFQPIQPSPTIWKSATSNATTGWFCRSPFWGYGMTVKYASFSTMVNELHLRRKIFAQHALKGGAGGFPSPWGYPHSWMVFVSGKILSMDDD